tara:strand:- start:96 stop:866 length:771 start_codon:yes stop_codon:yes gene_type:complete
VDDVTRVGEELLAWDVPFGPIRLGSHDLDFIDGVQRVAVLGQISRGFRMVVCPTMPGTMVVENEAALREVIDEGDAVGRFLVRVPYVADMGSDDELGGPHFGWDIVIDPLRRKPVHPGLHVFEKVGLLREEAVVLMDVFDRFQKVVVLLVTRRLRADAVILGPQTGVCDGDRERMPKQLDEYRMFPEPLVGPLSLKGARANGVRETPFEAFLEAATLIVVEDVLYNRDPISFEGFGSFVSVQISVPERGRNTRSSR